MDTDQATTSPVAPVAPQRRRYLAEQNTAEDAETHDSWLNSPKTLTTEAATLENNLSEPATLSSDPSAVVLSSLITPPTIAGITKSMQQGRPFSA